MFPNLKHSVHPLGRNLILKQQYSDTWDNNSHTLAYVDSSADFQSELGLGFLAALDPFDLSSG